MTGKKTSKYVGLKKIEQRDVNETSCLDGLLRKSYLWWRESAPMNIIQSECDVDLTFTDLTEDPPLDLAAVATDGYSAGMSCAHVSSE